MQPEHRGNSYPCEMFELAKFIACEIPFEGLKPLILEKKKPPLFTHDHQLYI